MPRVVVLRDQPDVLRVLRRSLLLEGWAVETTTTGAGAIAILEDSIMEVSTSGTLRADAENGRTA